jgi:tetratricopeptide (TPR) repeat protein
MFIYGLYGFLFVGGWIIMAIIIQLHQSARYLRWFNVRNPLTVPLIIICGALFIFGLITGGFDPLVEGDPLFITGAILLLLLPSLLFLLYGWHSGKQNPERVRIEKLKKQMVMDPRNPSPHIALAAIYEKSRRWGDALEEYQKVYDLYPEGGHRSRFLRKIKNLQTKWEKEEEEKTLECKACYASNDSKRWTCEECGNRLYQSLFQWASVYLPINWIIGAISFLVLFYFLRGIAIIILLPILLYFLFRYSRYRVERKRKELVASIDAINQHLKKDPENPVLYRSLSKAYQGLQQPGKALEELKKAYNLIPDDQSGYRSKLKREIGNLEDIWKIELVKKTLNCKACNAKNYPEIRRCEECGASQYKNSFHWAYSNFDPSGKKAIIAVPLIFSPFLIWLPFAYYFSINLIWLFNVVYFYYPYERFGTSED